MSATPRILLDSHALIGEGPVWDDRAQVLYWVDILDKCVHIYDPESGNDRRIDVGQKIGCLVLCESSGVMVALEDGIYQLDVDNEKLNIFTNIESQFPQNRFNEGKCDPAGRLWVGSMSM